MIGLEALYIAGLATLAGYLLIGRVPSVLFTPLLAGASFVHGIVLVGALLFLGSADDLAGRVIGVLAVIAATVNVVGGFIVMRRLFEVHANRQLRNPVQARVAQETGKESRGSSSSDSVS